MDSVCRSRCNKKAHAGKILLLMCVFFPTLLQPLEGKTCDDSEYVTNEGICCNKCSAGYKFVEQCHAPGQRTKCTSCPDDQYTDEMNYSSTCRSCKRCKAARNEIEEKPCEKNRNTICRCKDGYYKSAIDSETYECLKCTPCRSDEILKHTCTPERNTVCDCPEKFYRVNNKCKPCKDCTTECSLLCASVRTTIGHQEPSINDEYPKILVGTGAMVLVLLVLGIGVTYITTKRFTKKKLLNSSSKSPDVSLDPCERVLIHSVELSKDISVKATPYSPESEQEQLSSLPDCVPLEIKIPDLIYTLLDLVPVPQVKQLVRSLGVRDTEIEQAELDHRSCREAHYQMLRVWAERGSRAGGVLHRPLLQELLDKLRTMHLGGLAEDLETKYSIQ